MESFVAVRFWFCEILKTHFRITYIIKTNPYNFRISELRKLGLGKEGLQNLTGNQEKLLEEVLSRSAQMWWREVVVSAGGGGPEPPVPILVCLYWYSIVLSVLPLILKFVKVLT